MSRYYDHEQVQEFWQYVWERDEVYTLSDTATDPTYVLGMFPYTSGTLHMGHVRNYAITDAYARYRRMCGDDVLHPMGWDAFGLPAENAAYERATDPESWTNACIRRMREELETMGFGYDWSREITTCEPSYYRWNQWLFARLYEAGLVEYEAATVNWCPDCETVLADAQVSEPSVEATESTTDQPVERVCWRCETPVEHRELDQWFFTITDYAAELHQGLDDLDGWPDGVRESQRNWIGRQEGARIAFELRTDEPDVNDDGSAVSGDGEESDTDDDGSTVEDGETGVERIEVFSTRPDTIYGATYVAISPGHDLVDEIAAEDERIAAYVEDVTGRSPDTVGYAGVETSLRAIHPLTGAELPVYVAGYVLDDVGTGAVMGVPAHNERDYAFAREHDLPIETVVVPVAEDVEDDQSERSDEVEPESSSEPFTDDGVLVESDEYDGLTSAEARDRLLMDCDAITEDVTYRLRNWLISRQRYWGTPIPIVHCDDCGHVLVPDEELPVELPEFVHTTGNPIEQQPSFVETTCPECGEPARRETDTMDTFVDSSWYFLRYLSPDHEDAPFDTDRANEWMPVDVYVGGEEHAILHLLYIRFFTKALSDLGLLTHREPVERLISQGTVLYDGEKMSASKGNVVAPHEYGAETTRLFVLTAAHPEQDFEWTANNVRGAYELQQTLYKMATAHVESSESRVDHRRHDEYLDREIDRTIAAVGTEYERFRFHRAATEIQRLVGLLRRYREYETPHDTVFRRGLLTLAALIAPMAPHLGEEVWNTLRGEGLVATASWPTPNHDVSTAERKRQLVDTIRNDVRDIVTVADISDPETIEIVVAAPWKYRVATVVRDSEWSTRETDETADDVDTTASGDAAVGALVERVLADGDVDAPADRVAPFVAELVKRGQQGEAEPIADPEAEVAVLERAAWLLEDEFGATVSVEQSADDDPVPKARPGKPAIHID